MSEDFWEAHPDAPFAILIRVACTYCHPEAYEHAYDDLIARAQQRWPDGSEMAIFKEELRRALQDPTQLPDEDELFWAVQYSDGSDEKFLRRLWRDLYDDEPIENADREQ